MNITSSVLNRPQNKTRDMVYISFFAIVIAIGSWISIPTMIPFTLQTFAVFITVGILGGKRGAAAVSLYILLGVVGIPVFAGFKGGIGVLLGNTGGYILGFLLILPDLVKIALAILVSKRVSRYTKIEN